MLVRKKSQRDYESDNGINIHELNSCLLFQIYELISESRVYVEDNDKKISFIVHYGTVCRFVNAIDEYLKMLSTMPIIKEIILGG